MRKWAQVQKKNIYIRYNWNSNTEECRKSLNENCWSYFSYFCSGKIWMEIQLIAKYFGKPWKFHINASFCLSKQILLNWKCWVSVTHIIPSTYGAMNMCFYWKKLFFEKNGLWKKCKPCFASIKYIWFCKTLADFEAWLQPKWLD